MSGVAHQTHELPAGDECLATDFFAPDLDAGDWRSRSETDPATEIAVDEDPADPTPVEAGQPVDASVPPVEILPPKVDSDEDAYGGPTADAALLLPDERMEATAEACPSPSVAGLRLPRVADNEFLPGGLCALPELRVTPPPLALDPDERPVPDALPERRARRRRGRAWACACLVILAGEIGAGYWNAPPPEILVRDVAAASGIRPDDFVRIAEIESRLDPKAYNRLSKASGLFQLLPGTAKQYNVADSFDPKANAEAAARLFKHNAGRLKKALGREPTAWELYLAHQQGATGAIKLLKNPDKKAVDVVGRLPVLWNRGTEEMTAKQFAAMWREAFDGKKKTAVN
jgi:hypothetical protein